MSPTKPQVADFFAGLGGFTLGALEAGAQPVFAANHWAEAVYWHEKNHPEIEHVCQELGEMDKRRIPDVELLVASPACQGFSPNGRPGRVRPNAAVRHQADRNTAWAVISACDTKRPQRLLVENVPEMRHWGLFDAWLGCLHAMGYSTQAQVVNARDFGVAQSRRRLIVTGILDRSDRRAEFRIEATKQRERCIADCLETATGEPWHEISSKSESMQRRMRHAQIQAGGICYWANVDRSRGRPLDEPFPTVTTRIIGQAYLLRGKECRRLSARELARAQGFPDSYMLPKSRTLAGKLVGNAIPVPLAQACVEQILAD